MHFHEGSAAVTLLQIRVSVGALYTGINLSPVRAYMCLQCTHACMCLEYTRVYVCL